ncbi:GlxA family transcriptional regulator [Achromobacter xylosoxidans]|jgi:transcriptional regulator GlxA family with amidase domain|uniref:Helix-turn-helix domain-containing protein n=3 Tax=Alcaligenes xylosoxydans xylosoxydans TaxID=85698 RepID=A0A9W5AIZ0_ALCXX|nr:helix-turn-helix domain-containing protein [Achromobacter xylosoxidans]KAA5920716.1 helix-turn-helix domain-containing protein [Achromobacter xylosoxidans]KMJ87810.1 AraC family transcriptional regulator [Achromobacter xylosoxidans]MCH4571410.1 helix-turn-helix domain-containing protein [Achromobacter xylosoxidans]MCZ8386172.1 helix-turn-helix domain-containing protein [Achromobacter xylosoxidans]MCZ8402852.1 helix-turn-helix domain-containing protein [Achromobacter xylosoxidans]
MIPVYFVLPRGIVLLDVAGPAEAFRVANKLCPDAFAQHFCGPSTEVESGIPGLHLARIQPLPEKLPPEALVIVSGVVGKHIRLDEPEARLIIDWLAQRHPADGFTLMTVCAGALFAAAAGLTRQRECTTHHSCLAQLADLDPSARVHDNRIFVEDGNLVSSAGITAGIDLALHMVSRHCGPRVASEVARDMVVYQRRAGTDSALSPWLEHRNHMHPGVHRVQDAVVRNPAAPWSAQSLAEHAHTSPRHLTRLFREHAGCTPMDYLYQIRVALARDMLRETRLNLELVAEKSGFGSAQHLRRVWRRFQPQTPSMARTPAL